MKKIVHFSLIVFNLAYGAHPDEMHSAAFHLGLRTLIKSV